VTDASKILIEVDADGVPAEKNLNKTGAAVKKFSKDTQAEARKLAGVYEDASGRWREANGRFVSGARQVELGLKDVETQNQRTARSYGVAQRAGSGLSSMWRDQAQSLRQVERAGVRTGAVVAGLAAGGLIAATKRGLEFNAQMESNRIGLQQFLKTGQATDKFLGDLFQTARKTPFEFADVTDAAKKFLAFGFSVDQTKKSLQAIGDATAALGGGAEKIDRLVIAFGQIQAKGRVQGDELLQLAEAGIPAYQILQQKLGLTSKELANIGQLGIQSQDAIAALIDGMNERFSGATEKQSKSWAGMWSTIRDDTDQALGAMTKDLFDELEKNWLPAFDKTTQDIGTIWRSDKLTLDEKLDLSTDAVEKDLGPLFEKVKDAVEKANIPDKLGAAFAAATPKVIAGIEEGAKDAAKVYYNAFLLADPVGKALLAMFAAKKLGAIGLVGGLGKGVGGAVAGTKIGKGAFGSFLDNLAGKGKGAGVLGSLTAAGSSPTHPIFAFVVNDMNGKGDLPSWLKTAAGAGGGAAGVTVGAAAVATGATAASIYAASGGGIPTLKGGKDIIGDINATTESAREKVKLLTGALQDLDSEYSKPGKSHLDPAYGKAVQDLEKYKGALADAADQEDHYVAQMNRAIDKLASSHGRSLQDIESTTRRRAGSIRETLSENSRIGREMLAANFSAAASAIKTQMDAGAVSTKTGAEKINKYLTDAMKALGFDKAQIKHYMSSSTGDVSGKGSAGKSGSGQGAAKGMHMTLPGRPGPDSVPLDVNGTKIVAAPGEDVAVINGPQRRFLDQRLSDVGGLPGVFRRFNQEHVPGGGRRGGFAKGGIVPIPGEPGELISSTILSDVLALKRKYKLDITDGYAPTGHAAGGEHPLGLAIDAVPDFANGGSWDLVDALAKWAEPAQNNPRSPFRWVGYDGDAGHGRGNHIHLSWLHDAVAKLAASAKIKSAGWDGPGGTVGAIGRAGLEGVRRAAQAVLDDAGGGTAAGGENEIGGTGGASAKGDGADLMRSIAKARGWNFADWWALDGSETSHGRNLSNPTSTARLRGQFLDSNYGKYGPGSDPAQNPSMAEQIRSMAAYIAERYGNPTKAWAFHQVHNWYAAGGLAHAAKTDPSYEDWRSRATPTGGKKKKKKDKKKPKPFTGGPSYPKLDKIRGKKTKTSKKSKGTRAERLYGLTDGLQGVDPGVIPDFDRLYNDPADSVENTITRLQGVFGLTNEEPVVTLADTGSYKDLSAFFDAHPDLAKDYKDQVDSFDVVNWDQMMVQGKAVRGIRPHVAEIEQLLALYTGAGDGTGTEGLIGLRGREASSMASTTTSLSVRRDMAMVTLRQIHKAWNAESERREHAIGKVRKLSSGGQSWQQRVADNEARIKAIRDWKRDVSQDAVGHRKTEALQKQENKADQDIADLQAENDDLRESKPAPKQTVPKGASPKERAKIQKANAQRTGQLRHWTAVRDGAARELDALDGSRERWQTTDGVAGQWQKRIDAHNQALEEIGDALKTLTEVTIPAGQLEAMQLASERADWLGTTTTLPELQAKGPSQQDQAMADLLKQQLDQERQGRISAESQFGVFAGFAPLVSGRMLGSFAKGTLQPIAETGPAILHKGEHVVPAPDGPFGLDQRIASTSSSPNITVIIEGDVAPLMRRVRAEVDGRAAQVVSRQLGDRQRLLTIGNPRG
jgi:tape measure domain-containing protein